MGWNPLRDDSKARWVRWPVRLAPGEKSSLERARAELAEVGAYDAVLRWHCRMDGDPVAYPSPPISRQQRLV